MVTCPHCQGIGYLPQRTEPIGKCKGCGGPVFNFNMNSLFVPDFCEKCYVKRSNENAILHSGYTL
jgi:hypothetical protein